MRIKTLAIRILNQLRHDKRTVAMVIFAPLLILTLIYFILNSDNTTYQIGIVSAPEHFISELKNTADVDIEITQISRDEMQSAIKNETVSAAVLISSDSKQVDVYMDGTDASKAQKLKMLIQRANAAALQKSMQQQVNGMKIDMEPEFHTKYIYGSENATFFDNFGAPLIGLVVFFFVFLIAGINFLGERTSGTLEKMLSTPIRRGEIIVGYVLGFSILALIQTTLVTLFVVYVLGLTVAGSLWYVFLINLLTAITALSLGILLSTMANNEFQMVQFIPLVIFPQVFLCGLFDLSGGWKIAGYFMPLTYTTDALREVMLRGNGFSHIWLACLVLLGFALLFMAVNVRLLRRQRSI